MKEHQDAVGQQDFDALLSLFSHDREEAGRAYERMRAGLERFFSFRGCSDPGALADETLNRVALKASDFSSGTGTRLTTYVYGFASNVFLEYLRSPRRKEFVDETGEFLLRVQASAGEDREPMFDCLQACLDGLNPDERGLFIEYYSHEGQAKIETRKRLADRMGCRVEALHTRVFRLKTSLRKCVGRCVSES